MKKRNSPPKSTTRKRGKTTRSSEKPQLTDRAREKAILETWANVNMYPSVSKKANTVERNTTKRNTAQQHHSSQAETYVLREMPASVHALTLNTLCRKVCQDIFLKAELMQGHQVIYVPAWETYPLWIEESVIAAAKSKTPIKLSVLRKRCRARHKQELEVQKEKFHQLGIFADWDASQKTLESRQEARLIALISRLRDSDYLHDLPQLSPWCPKCTVPINEANLVQMPTRALNGYVKFPFTLGLEEFGISVSFCLQMPHLWEIAGVVELGITENITYLLTQWRDEYLLFSEPQFEHFMKHLPKRQSRPKLVKEIKASELAQCAVAHPLFPSKDVKITLIPDALVADATPSKSTSSLKSGVMPLNPAHHQPSYNIAQALNMNATPVFDETGRFTEEAGQLCGLYLFDAKKFIIPQLERYGYLLKTRNDEMHEPHCPRCKELAVFRPCSKWVFSISENRATAQLLNAQEYWDNYGDTEHKDIRDVQNAVLNFGDLQVSAQRQWGMPLPILLCDQCDEPLTDKNTLNAIRNSIQRGFEFWFRLSVEELLPADTRCLNCNSSDFRKEATLIDSHFANLLQIIDNSDFKKPLGGHTSVMFVPQTDTADSKWTEWLAEISVISAALSRSRPIKESQPFKQLKLNTMPKIDSDIQIEDAFLNKYPADVARLVAITPSVGTEQVDHKQLEKLAKDYSVQYQQLQGLLEDISDCLSDFLQNGNETKNASGKKGKDKKQGKQEVEAINLEAMRMEETGAAATDEIASTDSLAIAVTAQFLQGVRQTYQDANFYEMWTMLTDFCENDLRFYVQTVKSRPAETLHAAQTALSQIGTALLQRLAPLVPFLAEHFYPRISTEGVAGNHSIFQKNWHLLLPVDGQILHISGIEEDKAKAEWEVLKNTYDAKF
ncbi:MAG: class I tRNA ligase family protein [Candidatus Poribacteria bacterium]|nr:class I tRNA ligase family protein [Candidatus Poribacteria bacterium]